MKRFIAWFAVIVTLPIRFGMQLLDVVLDGEVTWAMVQAESWIEDRIG